MPSKIDIAFIVVWSVVNGVLIYKNLTDVNKLPWSVIALVMLPGLLVIFYDLCIKGRRIKFYDMWLYRLFCWRWNPIFNQQLGTKKVFTLYLLKSLTSEDEEVKKALEVVKEALLKDLKADGWDLEGTIYDKLVPPLEDKNV